ncbi:MAG TPA: hypothetical protein VL172_18730, partial [Kofleriaceae bacterium]|nr:hypothetical protein [Kofleriaceae bacterium]
MASHTRGILLVLALGVAAGLGFAYYYFKVMVPGNERQEARSQVTEWGDKHWRPLRSCLVGPQPRAAAGRDALFLRAALTTGSLPGAKDCARFFVELRRPGTTSTTDRDIELAWRALEGKTARLANAYLDIDYERAATLKKVGEGIDAVDAAYGGLREVVGLEPDPVIGPEAPPALPAGTPITGSDGLIVDQVLIAGDALLAQGARSDDSQVWMTMRGPRDFQLEGMPGGNVRLAAADALTRVDADPLLQAEALGRALGDEDERVRVAALGGLARLGG